MTLNQALTVLRAERKTAIRRTLFLYCGFQPVHLETFFKAYLQTHFPDSAIEILTGLFGDLEGTLASITDSAATAAAGVIEWGDIDSRLSLRSSGGWSLAETPDILSNCRERWERILELLAAVSQRMAVALALPTLPIPLFGHTAGWQLSRAEAELSEILNSVAARAALLPNLHILHPQRLAELSPEASRRDPNLELAAGFPYSLSHASILAAQLVHLLFPPSPKKGLITDLDDTLWSGIVGESGVQALAWSLEKKSQVHGLYQQELRNLSEMGVMLAVASKNEPAVVEEALTQDELYLPGSIFFPVKASWRPKSESIREILQTWNIGPESVVFIDDNPMEIGEVQSAFPSMTCLPFPGKNSAKAIQFLTRLRDLFGKPTIHSEDLLRQSSIRAVEEFREFSSKHSTESFVRDLRGKITFDTQTIRGNDRLLELINKTNQFNLNGYRISAGEWLHYLDDPSSIVIGVSYEDRFGPLGTIGVIAGRQNEGIIEVTSWVLSCRAFSRKIEYHMLDYLFRLRPVKSISLAFSATERNIPFQEFLHFLGWDGEGPCEIKRQMCPNQVDLPHEVHERNDK